MVRAMDYFRCSSREIEAAAAAAANTLRTMCSSGKALASEGPASESDSGSEAWTEAQLERSHGKHIASVAHLGLSDINLAHASSSARK